MLIKLQNEVKKEIYKNKGLLATILLFILIFIVLYNKFIFSDYVFAYSLFGDLGSDTINSYYPIYYFFSNIIHGGDSGIYSFNLGLGSDIISYFSYVNFPLDLPIILFPPEYLHYGLIVGNFIKLLIISIFSYKFFNLILKREYSKLNCSLIWTFSSYIVLWGQHYFFATNMVYFTIFLYYLQRYIINPKSKNLFLIVTMCLFALSSYYFFYMAGIFSVIYILIFGLYKKKRIKDILYIIIKLGLLAMLSIGIVSVLLFPTLLSFFNSVRTNNITNFSSLFLINPKEILTVIARSLSTNLLGDANWTNFSGTSNYYEAPLLYSSILFYFSFIYILAFKKGKRIKKIAAVCLYAIILIAPFFTHLLTFNSSSMRWTYMLIILQIIITGKFLDECNIELHKKGIIKLVIMSLIFIFFFVFFLLLFDNKIITISKEHLLCVIIISSICGLILMFNRTKVFKVLITIFVVCELIVVNYATINTRGIEKSEKFLAYYNDGTKEAVVKISERDKSLYRIQKSYLSKHLNDALVQGYNGTNTYFSVNSKSLINFFNSFTLTNIYNTVNCVEFSYLYPYVSSILSTKYLISNSEIYDENFSELDRTSSKIIYKNNNYLPFGYVYHEKVNIEDFSLLTQMEKMAILSNAFYFTESASNTDYLPEMDTYVEKIDFTKNMVENYPINNSYELDLNNLNRNFNQIEIMLNTLTSGDLIVYFDYGEGYDEANKIIININNLQKIYTIPISNEVSRLKINSTMGIDELNIDYIKLLSINNQEIHKNFVKLRDEGLKNIDFDGKKLSGTITNNKDTGMLCMPIIYSNGWKAKVDGKSVITYNINGGLTGIELPNGMHEIELEYSIPGFNIGVIISIFSIATLLVYLKGKKIKKFN